MIEDSQVSFEELVGAVRNQKRFWVRLGAVLKSMV